MSTPQGAPLRERIGYQAGLLGVFSTVAAALLMAGHLSTREAIAARQQEDLEASLGQVMPRTLHDNSLLADTREVKDPGGGTHLVYRATREGRVTGLVYQVSGLGYSGAIDIIMAVDPHGALLGVRVLSHAETPGLGDKVEPEKDDWILRFAGLSLGKPPEDQWKVKKDGGQFDQFTGATITPRAVVKAVREGLSLFRDHREALLAPSAPAGTPGAQAGPGRPGA